MRKESHRLTPVCFYFLVCMCLRIIFSCSAYAQTSSDITSLLSSEGKALFGEEPNSILVIDYPKNIKKIEDYLKMVDTPPQQVIIEARIVDVKLQGEFGLGINWQAFAEKGGFEIGQFHVGSTPGGSLDQNIPFKPTFYPPGSVQSTNEETPFTMTIFDENINLVLNSLANTLDTNILSAPRITTVNNRQAEIKVIREVRWVVPEVVVEEGVVTLTWNEAEDSPREVGIILKVVPMITEDGQISMELEPEVSEHVTDLELTAVAGTTEVPYTIPIIDTRKAETKVVIGNMQTLIIGGMIKERKTKGITKIPFLGDIPLLGWLFKSERDTKERSELLIFVSPTIITPEVVMRMKREERTGVGKWYMQSRGMEDKLLLNEREVEQIGPEEDSFISPTAYIEKDVINRLKNKDRKSD